MPWSYLIDPDRNLLIATATGVLTEQELRDGVPAVYADPRFHQDLHVFLDYASVTEWKVSSDLLAELAAQRPFSDRSRTAIWVKGSLGYGMTRIYQAWVDHGQVRIFADRADAVAWLNENLPPELHLR